MLNTDSFFYNNSIQNKLGEEPKVLFEGDMEKYIEANRSRVTFKFFNIELTGYAAVAYVENSYVICLTEKNGFIDIDEDEINSLIG